MLIYFPGESARFTKAGYFYGAELKKLAEEQEELATKQADFDRKERDKVIAENAAREAEESAKEAVERAERARALAETRAKQDAINTENARKQAIVDADNAKAAAVQKVREESAINAQVKERAIMEDQRIAREKKDAEDMAETDWINDEKHRSQIHRAIYLYLLCTDEGDKDGLDADQAKGVTQSLIDGNVPNVKIQY